MLLFHAIKEKHNAREEYSCDQYITHTDEICNSGIFFRMVN